MQFSLFLSTNMSTGSSRTIFIVAIAVLACLLGAEIAGIGVLISKIMRARRIKRNYEAVQEQEEHHSSYLHGIAFAAPILSAIPQSLQITFVVLLSLTAFFAALFVFLLLIFRACGYDYFVVPKKDNSFAPTESHAEDRAELEALPDDSAEDEQAFASLWQKDDEEAASQAPYAEIPETEDDHFHIFAEETAETSDEFAEDTEADADAFSTYAEPIAIDAVEDGTQVADEAQQPYRVVERVVTETVKEVYKEVPTQQTTTSAGNDAVIEKLVDLLDYEIRSRREGAQTVEPLATGESIPTFSPILEDEDDEDEDDLTADEREGGDDEDDGEDQENDDRFTGNEKILGFNEETGCYIVAHYRKSFEAKLIQSQPRIKQYYSALKNALLSYKGTKNRISWTADSFHNGRHPLAKINVKTRILEIYLALDPASLEGTVYRGKDVGDKKKYVDTPFQYKVRTPRKFKWAMELVQRVCEEHGLSPIDIEPVDYEAMYPFEDTDSLVARKLIKEYIREEKPATSFELASDHTPAIPDEDESVIPANANFSWEFDNERMEEQTEEASAEELKETVEEPLVIEETVEEPTATEEEPAVLRETVKITEMRYTEHYYPDGKTSYEETLITNEPTEAIDTPEEVEAPDEVMEENAFAEAEKEKETVEDVAFGEAEETDEPTEDATVEADELFFADELPVVAPIYTEEDEVERFEPEESDFEERESDEPEAEQMPEPEVQETFVQTSPSINTTVAKVDLCAIEAHYRDGETVNLQTLKAKQLIIDSAQILKVRASGALTKALNVEAHQIHLTAIFAIDQAGGNAAILQ